MKHQYKINKTLMADNLNVTYLISLTEDEDIEKYKVRSMTNPSEDAKMMCPHSMRQNKLNQRRPIRDLSYVPRAPEPAP